MRRQCRVWVNIPTILEVALFGSRYEILCWKILGSRISGSSVGMLEIKSIKILVKRSIKLACITHAKQRSDPGEGRNKLRNRSARIYRQKVSKCSNHNHVCLTGEGVISRGDIRQNREKRKASCRVYFFVFVSCRF